MTNDSDDRVCASQFTFMQACMVLYRDLGDRPFPAELWAFLADTFGEGPMMVRFGRFGRASFCVVVKAGLFQRLYWSVGALYSPVEHDYLIVRVCRFRITVPVNFRYWFIWQSYRALDLWISQNSFGFRAVDWPQADRLRGRIVSVFQRACRLHVLDANGSVADVGSY